MISFKITVGEAIAPFKSDPSESLEFTDTSNINKYFDFAHKCNKSDVELVFGDNLLDTCPEKQPKIDVMVGGRKLAPSTYNELKVLGVTFPYIIDNVLVKNYVDDYFVFVRDAYNSNAGLQHLGDVKKLIQKLADEHGEALTLLELATSLKGTSISFTENLGSDVRYYFESKQAQDAIVLTNALLSFCFTDHSDVNIQNRLDDLPINLHGIFHLGDIKSIDLTGVMNALVLGFKYKLPNPSEHKNCHRSIVHSGWR